MAITTKVIGTLDVGQRRQVETLVAAVTRADKVAPLNESAQLDVHSNEVHDGVAHLLAHRGTELVGYAHLDSATGGPEAQLAVAPNQRRHGVATEMIRALGYDTLNPEYGGRYAQGLTLTLWSFGDLPGARALAKAQGYREVRRLLVMERDLSIEVPAATFAEDVTVRTFDPKDAEAWLRVNARAFASHPEQGNMTNDDLRARAGEPWYDERDFFVATVPGAGGRPELVGFHWTKKHTAQLAEVYVLAVDPAHGGGGLGRNLLNHGLQHMADNGAQRVILYVESDQEHVVELYRSANFEITNADIMYMSPSAPRGDSGDSRPGMAQSPDGATPDRATPDRQAPGSRSAGTAGETN